MPPIVAAAAAGFSAVQGAVAAAGIMKSMAVVGTAMSALGAVTKNEKLMKIGAVVGTVGSLGTMGAFGQGAKTLGMSSSAKAAAAANRAATSAVTGAMPQPGALRPRAGVLDPAFGGGAVQQPGLLSQTMQQASTLNLPPPAPTTLLQKAGSALSSGANMIKDNPEVAMVLAQGGAELANYLSGKTDAEIRQLESSISANDANAQRTLFTIAEEKRRRANIQGAYLPTPVQATPVQVNPYQPTGIIAGAMPRGV
jgi:hypothetical protein